MTSFDGPEVDVLALDQQLCFALYAASRAVVRSYGPLLDKVGLTYPQYVTLLALWDSPGPLTVKALGERLHLDSGTLTPLLKRLEAQGLITRQRSAEDERRTNVELTTKGRRLRRRVENVPRQVASALAMDAAEAVALRDQLQHLTALLVGL
ncbi:MAG: putative mgrA, HTH-type transcriptional regulator [Acidimicrobiia bacterium]|nr:putative mgrA, HTH-type transcriptional regulator [Acidimicrobiia bacterium]